MRRRADGLLGRLRKTARGARHLLDRDGEDVGRCLSTSRPIIIVTSLRRRGAVGVNTHIAEFEALLERKGLHHHTVSLDSWVPVIGPLLLGMVVIRRSMGRRGATADKALIRVSLRLSLMRRFRSELPSVVYAQDPGSAEAAIRARGRRRVPIAMAVHYNQSEADELVGQGTIQPGGTQDQSVRRREARVLRQLDALVFVSEFMRGHTLRHTPEAARIPTIVVPNFLRDAQEADVGAPSRDCITVGYMVDRKRQRLLLDVIAEARARGHRYTFTLVGDGPAMGELRAHAESLGISDQVAFLGNRHDVDQLLRQHRLYIHGAAMENCPFAIIEAFRAGIPVLTTAVGGITEVVQDGTGWFWDPTEVETAAQALVRALEDRHGLGEAGRRARSRFETTYAADEVGPRLQSFLESLTGNVGGTARNVSPPRCRPWPRRRRTP